MDINELASDIVDLPKEFYNNGNISIYSLLKETGYFEHHSKISESDLRDQLVERPENIQHWVKWSEDKRTSSGWYIENKGGKCIVGYFPEKENAKPKEYSSVELACAAFIKLEIEEIRKS